MNLSKKLLLGLLLFVFVGLALLTLRACINSISTSSEDFERSIRQVLGAEQSIQEVFEKNEIVEIIYTGREPGRYSNGIAFFDLKNDSADELLIYWSLNRTTEVYSIDRLVLRDGSNSKIIWKQ